MARPLRRDRRGTIIALLVLLFMASGATSLVYETIWVRELHLVVGTGQVAVCTVLASFMAGLALGALAAARWASRVRNPVLVYAALEAIIGLYALVFPLLLRLVEPLYLGFWRAFEPPPVVFAGFSLVLLGLLLLPPTACMGATLPLLARFAATQAEETGGQVGRLYGANTIGAVIGTLLAGFLLLPQLGLHVTTLATAGANGVIAVVAAVVARAGRSLPAAGTTKRPDPRPRAAPGLSRMGRALMLMAALGGAAGLIYEVAWFRLLVLMLGGSSYAFTLMLVAFLLGIGIGGWAGGAAADRAARGGDPWRVLRQLAWLQMMTGLAAWGAMYAYGELPIAVMRLETWSGGELARLWPAKLGLCLLVMLPPALLMGASFPYLVRAAADAGDEVTPAVGRLYGANTLGALVGAVVAGLFLLPVIHVRGTVLAAAALNVAVAFTAAAYARAGAERAGLGALRPLAFATVVMLLVTAVVRPPWNPLLMTSGMYHYASRLPQPTRAALLANTVGRNDLLFYDEGLSTVVTVGRDRATGTLWLANNGKVDATTSGDLDTQVLVAHIPLLFHDDPKRVLVIGLASGITLGAATLHAEPERIDVAELEPAVVAASRVFDEYSHAPLDDPRVRLVLNDGRNHLVLAADDAYDVVISEPSNPWITGVSNLFTREFFEVGRRVLAPDGVWAQWVQTYNMAPQDMLSLLGTFADVFPHAQVHLVRPYDLILVGSESPLPLDTARLEPAIARHEAVRRDLTTAAGITTAADLVALFQVDREAILALAAGVERNTDDNMRIEYSAPLYHGVNTIDANLEMLARAARVPYEAIHGGPDLLALARAYERLRDPRIRPVVETLQRDHPALLEEAASPPAPAPP